MASTNVKVSVRCRPMSSTETRRGCHSVVDVSNQTQSINVKKEGEADGKKHNYTYDHAYPPDTQQAQIYQDIGAPLVTKAFEGFNGTIFAYGQTGSGKTFTMMGVLGDKDLAGVIPRLIDDMYSRVAAVVASSEGKKQVMITVSYLEIYNEVVHDLLNPQVENSNNLKIREHPDLGIYVDKLCELVAKDGADIMRLIEQGNRIRKVATTQMNERSSRSHSVFTLKVGQKEIQALEGGVERETALASKLNLVDLAGSERADKTGAEGSTLKEGAAINQSLMALGGVINALSEGLAFVPYRNSKLTRLLQESLGGNAATMMVANVSPADYNVEETIGTLRYASRAKNIKNVVTRNEDVHEKVIRELQEEIERLRLDLQKSSSHAPSHTMTEEQEKEFQEQLRLHQLKESTLEERLANMEHAKQGEWQQREALTKQLEEERQNNLSRQIKDVMASVKSEKLRLINELRAMQDERNDRTEQLGVLNDEYRESKRELEGTMHEYEDFQTAYDRMDPSDPTYESSGEKLISMLNDIEALRANLIDVRRRLGETKAQVQSVEESLSWKKAELQAAASTIAEHDRLRDAIQNEERAAFQSQRDAYLSEQLASERDHLAAQERELQDKAASMQETGSQNEKKLETLERHNQLLKQELHLFKKEKERTEDRLQVVTADLESVVDERHKLEGDYNDLESRLQTSQYSLEEEQSKAEELREELWKLKNAAEAQRRELEEAARKAKQEVASVRRAQRAEEKARRSIVVTNSPPTNGQPIVAESKDDPREAAMTKGLSPAAKASSMSTGKQRELEVKIAEYEDEKSTSAAMAKESEYQIFKSVMDIANKDRAELQGRCSQLEQLMRQSIQDIMFLQESNGRYKAELDQRRRHDDD